ncbi:MAG: hypothetical protein DRJ38_03420 [Thermoprotei archaeon]|nr:MAG: hypothetical protein DRJ38_03420 [Thermoprotei archaeon]
MPKKSIVSEKSKVIGCTEKTSAIVQAPLCPDCGEEMRYCYNEYSVQLWVCPRDRKKVYITAKEVRGAEFKV